MSSACSGCRRHVLERGLGGGLHSVAVGREKALNPTTWYDSSERRPHFDQPGELEMSPWRDMTRSASSTRSAGHHQYCKIDGSLLLLHGDNEQEQNDQPGNLVETSVEIGRS